MNQERRAKGFPVQLCRFEDTTTLLLLPLLQPSLLLPNILLICMPTHISSGEVGDELIFLLTVVFSIY